MEFYARDVYGSYMLAPGNKKKHFILINPCNLLNQTRDLFFEPIHKTKLIQSQAARISLFTFELQGFL